MKIFYVNHALRMKNFPRSGPGIINDCANQCLVNGLSANNPPVVKNWDNSGRQKGTISHFPMHDVKFFIINYNNK